MRNLLRFIWNYRNLVWFILLETFCIYLVFKNNQYQKASWISSSNLIAGNVFTTVNSVKEYFSLKETNEALASENARLHSISPSAYAKYINDTIYIHDTVYKQQYSFLNARIVNNSVNRRNNYLTLNKGSLHGIKPEMAVISSNGIVGITKQVSDHFTSVLSVLNKEARISAKVKKTGDFGSLSWDGTDYRYGTLVDIPTHVPLKTGDTIVTNAYSKIFPDNILIGLVERFEIIEGDDFYTIKVRFTTNFKNLTHVFVINNLLKDEQKKLEEESQNDN